MFVRLIDGLPTDSLMPTLISKGVISAVHQNNMKQQTDNTQKTLYLLNDIVIPSLRVDVLKTFEQLLLVMEESKDLTCQSLATELNSRLGHGEGHRVEISFPKIIPPSGS